MTGFLNKDYKPVNLEDIFYDGKIYWVFGFNGSMKKYYLMSCQQGYKFDFTQEYISTLEPAGAFKGNEKLFECD